MQLCYATLTSNMVYKAYSVVDVYLAVLNSLETTVVLQETTTEDRQYWFDEYTVYQKINQLLARSISPFNA